jgi:regulatory subunit for Cdc7p protein kinase
VTYKPSEKEVENVRQWQAQTKSRFPKMVVYFESIPDEQRVKLAKQVISLGGVSHRPIYVCVSWTC